MRNEIITQITSIKKDVKIKTSRKDEESKKKKQESQFAAEKAFEEIKSLKEKL